MTMLIAAAFAFLAIHLFVSGTRLRDVFVKTIGEGAYMGLFSLASLGAIVWLVIAFAAADGGPQDRALYDLGVAVGYLAVPVVAFAFFLGVQGLLAPNPTSVRQEHAVAKESTIHGVVRITRHPFLWGVAIWAAFHLAANGRLARVIFFGTFLVLAVLGTLSIDAKRKRKLGTAWDAFAQKTSNVPFAAILAGRNSLHAGESLGWRFGVAMLVFLAALFGHARFFGVSPFPNGWVPF